MHIAYVGQVKTTPRTLVVLTLQNIVDGAHRAICWSCACFAILSDKQACFFQAILHIQKILEKI